MTDEPNICYSGGCSGADYFFGLEAAKHGHQVYHYAFRAMFSPVPKKELNILSPLELSDADTYLAQVNDLLLHRQWPTKTEYGNNLLRRNYAQIKHSQRIYAATRLDDNDAVIGGTGWTIALGLFVGISEIYIYDWEKNKYFAYDWPFSEMGWHWYELPVKDIPIPHGHYTGIGSHDLPINGVQAIRKLYDRSTT